MTDSRHLARRFGLTDEQLSQLIELLTVPTGEVTAPTRVSAGTLSDAVTWSPDRAEAAPVTNLEAAGLPDRYEDRGLLGVGGMGEVRRVWDLDLMRTVAMKILKPELSVRAKAVNRFVQEAQTSAQLQHPGVLPVHELGKLPDGRVYFTMQEIRGRTLKEAIAELHGSVSESGFGVTPSGLTFRRVIEALRTVCEAVGYAHRRGVVHRDLKPANLLLGDDGEVLVVDWGIARVQEASPGVDPVVTDGGLRAITAEATSLAGTPAYMPPEQARGDPVGPHTDVWALGAVLYEVLCGVPPHHHLTDVHSLVVARMTGQPPTPVRELARGPVPEELADAVEQALSPQPTARQRDGAALAAQIGSWLDGEARKAKARQMVVRARDRLERARALRSEAEGERRQASASLAGIDEAAPEQEKLDAWAHEDRAQELAREAELAGLDAEQQLHAALLEAPDLAEARRLLAEHYRGLHHAAEAKRDAEAARRAEAFLRTQVAALPEGPDKADHLRYLEGMAALTLVTEPPGAEVVLYRFETHRRRLVPRADRVLGRTPLVAAPLPAGSWLASIRHPDCEDVAYPVHVERLGHWDGVPPGASEPAPVSLPPRGSLEPGDCYVAPGWFQAGGDPDAPGAHKAQWRWADAFVIRRDPVTNREWLRFVQDIADTEGLEAAWRVVPTDSSGLDRDEGIPIYRLDERGRFEVGADPDGDEWELDWPVVMITLVQMERFLAWRNRDGARWRLAADLEWEKAGRGVDGRHFPWGDHFDPSWCSNRRSRPVGLYAVDALPVDESVYGVRGMAGNSAEFVLETFEGVADGDRVVIPDAPQSRTQLCGRGGAWASPPNSCRLASRGFSSAQRGLYSHGLRIVHGWPIAK